MMQKGHRLWSGETLVYILVWVAVTAVCLLTPMRDRNESDAPLINGIIVWNTIKDLLPLFVLFIVNTYVLVPGLLLRNKLTWYFVSALVMILGIWLIQLAIQGPPPLHKPPSPPPPPPRTHGRSVIFFPEVLNFTYDILVVVLSLAVTLVFQRFKDRLIMEQRLKNDADAQLKYLKAQISPHFYMNMLNNLHGLIEIDPEKAQQTVLDMSKLMRYQLYDCSHRNVALAKEVEYLDNYITLMKSRYPEDKVSIKTHYPTAAEMEGVVIPPLLFVVFVENAFKHGISFRRDSWVTISVTVSKESIIFICANSCYRHEENRHKPGIGLQNVKQRLKLIYGNKSILNCTRTEDSYSVTLILPK